MPANGEGYLPGKGKNTFTHRTREQDSILKKAQRQGMPQTRPRGGDVLARCICGQLFPVGSMVCWFWELTLMRVSPVGRLPLAICATPLCPRSNGVSSDIP